MKKDREVREPVVLYGELPRGVIQWLERTFHVKVVPELNQMAKLILSMKLRIVELQAEKEAEEYLNKIKKG